MGAAENDVVHERAKPSPEEDLITGITEGLEDFAAGRCKHFKTAEEMIAYLRSL